MAHPTEARLHAFVDRELEPQERQQIEAHVEACSTCQQRLAGIVSLFERLEQIPDQPLPRDLSTSVVRAVRARRRESALLARLAWAQTLLALGIGALVWLVTGGIGLGGGAATEFSRLLALLQTEANVVFEVVAITAAQASSELSAALAQPIRLPAAHLPDLPGGLAWAPALVLALLLWLLSNGVLLRGGGTPGSN